MVVAIVSASIIIAALGLYLSSPNYPNEAKVSPISSTTSTVVPPATTAAVPTSASNPSMNCTTSSAKAQTATGHSMQITIAAPLSCHVYDQYRGTGSSFVAYQIIPLKIYSTTPETVSLTALNAPPGTWMHFDQDVLTATSAGIPDNLTLIGAMVPFEPTARNYTLMVDASSGPQQLNATLPVIPVAGPTIIRSSGGSILPSKVIVPSNNSIPWDTTVVYDPSGTATPASVLGVTLKVLGISSSGSVQPLPNWLDINFPQQNLTLTAFKPAILSIHESNTLALSTSASSQTYSVAVSVAIDGVASEQFISVTITPPVQLAPP
jgi:hypothetical protein